MRIVLYKVYMIRSGIADRWLIASVVSLRLISIRSEASFPALRSQLTFWERPHILLLSIMANTHDLPSMAFSKILSHKGCDVSEAVKEFSKHINDAADKKSPKVAEDALWSSWRDFSKVVAPTQPGDQDCLVQFLLKLRDGEGGEKPLKVWGSGTTLKSLPLFGPEMRYVWNEGRPFIRFSVVEV